nr:hypothetical protein [Anaerolineae bacterium]
MGKPGLTQQLQDLFENKDLTEEQLLALIKQPAVAITIAATPTGGVEVVFAGRPTDELILMLLDMARKLVIEKKCPPD